MKKTIGLMLTLLLAFALTACARQEHSDLPEDWQPEESFSFALDNEEEAFASEKIILEQTADFEYSVTWTPSGLSTEIGLEAEDGTRYKHELARGEVQGRMQDIPAGVYRVYVRNTSSFEKFPKADLRRLSGSAGFAVGQAH